MRHCRILVCSMAGVVALAAAIGLAQPASQPGGEEAPKPKLVPLTTEKPAGGGAEAGTPNAPGDANQTTTQPGGKPRDDGSGSSLLGGQWFMIILLGGFVLLYVWMGRGRRKQEAKRKEMLAALKKGDKVVTIGGIMGTIMSSGQDELTVKVDETSNVRMKFARWAVRGVGEEGKQNPDQKK
jgi:preprotein translocase subunit YajC